MTAAYRAHLPRPQSLVLVTGAYACVFRNSSRTTSEHRGCLPINVRPRSLLPLDVVHTASFSYAFLLIYYLLSSSPVFYTSSSIPRYLYTLVYSRSFPVLTGVFHRTQLIVCLILSFLLDHTKLYQRKYGRETF